MFHHRNYKQKLIMSYRTNLTYNNGNVNGNVNNVNGIVNGVNGVNGVNANVVNNVILMV